VQPPAIQHPGPIALPSTAIVHADAWLLVVDKPAGLLAVPGRGEAGLHNLLALLQRKWPDALVVHRLDMATSGLIVFARGAAMQRLLSMQFAARTVTKRYDAVVHGCIDVAAGAIALPLAADWPRRPRQRVDLEHGKPALTWWSHRQSDPSAAAPGEGSSSRLALEPVTGRTHQLRVHLQAIGHPIVGDALYGPADDPHPRLLLHATALGLTHPATGKPCRFESEAPF
jgi:tRNA pseudouridine32 synthase / 23S rRNA pseudouridine746 synthase